MLKLSPLFFRRPVAFGAAFASLAILISALGASPISFAKSEPVVAARYPLDPVCPWGRLGDGKGILVRCLKQSEAKALLAKEGGTFSSTSAQPAPPAVDARPSQKIVVRSVGVAKPDTGSLPEARSQLAKAKARYVTCAQKNGGLEGTAASVTVRFLVRERGRAEGVSVIRRRGLSEAAAKCIAEVVDRRYVGFPEAPIVGVTMQFKLATESLVP